MVSSDLIAAVLAGDCGSVAGIRITGFRIPGDSTFDAESEELGKAESCF